MSMMDFSGVDFSGLANFDFSKLDLRDSQGRYPMDPGYDPTPAAEVSSPVFAGGTLDRPTADGVAPVVTPTESDEDRRIREANERENAQAETARLNRRKDARSTINTVLASYGLEGLADYTYNEIIVKETVNLNNPDAIIFALREQPTYKKRFAGNAARLKAGLAELDPASYIGLENQFRETLRSNGLAANFYDGTDDFQALIEGDVSPS